MRTFLLCLAPLVVASWCAAGMGCGGNAFSAGTNDGGPPSQGDGGPSNQMDGGLHDAPSAEAGPSWCSTQTGFCEDFDEYPADGGTLLGGATWPDYGQTNGSFDFDTTTPKSPPNSLQVVGDDSARIFIVHVLSPLAALPKSVRLEFDLRVNSPGTEAALAVAGFAAIAFGGSLDSGYAAVGIGKGPALSVSWVTPADNKFNSAAGPAGSVPSSGQWAGRYGIELDLNSTSGGTDCAVVYQVPNMKLTTCLPLPAGLAKPGIFSIALGDVGGGTGITGHVDLEFDNVTLVIIR